MKRVNGDIEDRYICAQMEVVRLRRQSPAFACPIASCARYVELRIYLFSRKLEVLLAGTGPSTTRSRRETRLASKTRRSLEALDPKKEGPSRVSWEAMRRVQKEGNYGRCSDRRDMQMRRAAFLLPRTRNLMEVRKQAVTAPKGLHHSVSLPGCEVHRAA